MAWANEKDSPKTLEPQIAIEAKSFPVRVLKRSNSNRIYLIEDVQNRQTQVGRVLLFKDRGKAAMGFRVIKLYPSKQLIATKRIKRYGDRRVLDPGEAFQAHEKIAELGLLPSARDVSELKRLEVDAGLHPKHFDPELDRGTSPQLAEELEDIRDIMTIEETRIIDLNKHWASVSFGYVRNGGPTAGTFNYFAAGALRYGLTIGSLMVFKEPTLQDSIALEVGGFLYKSLSFATTGDSYTSVTLTGTIRYNLVTSISFGMYGYAGLSQGLVLGANNPSTTVLQSLSQVLLAGGIGFLFQIGPGWYTRVNMGLDSIDLGLCLRF